MNQQTLIVVFGATLLGFGGYFLVQSLQPASVPLQPEQDRVPEPQPVSPKTPSLAPTAEGWSLYHGTTYSIEYPSSRGWVYEADENSVHFGPSSSEPGGYIWGVYVYSKSSVDISKLIARTGDQFSDRKETREIITVGGLPAVLVTVTTSQVDGWVSKTVYVEHDNNLYAIGNGAIEDTAFAQFYNSFKLN